MNGGFGRGESSRGREYRSRGRGARGDGPPESKYHKQVSDEAEEEVRELFQKKFTFKDELHEWTLPEPSQIFQEPFGRVDELLKIRDKLNSTKSKLDDKDLISWHKHTKFTNRAANIIPAVRNQFSPELCTQGWTKMQEILTSFAIVPHRDVRLNSLHLCEVPGAFITSLNHFLKTHRGDVVWQWKAMTLNPYYEGNDLSALIDQDRFMMMTADRWFLGGDNSGNVMVWDNAVGLLDLLRKEMKDVNLITADGSIDCVNNPAEQEELVAQLLFCEAFIAMKGLKEGGNFVIKTFTTLECQTVCLLYLLCACFREVTVFKPVTSKAGNSEQYIVCMKYKGKALGSAHWERLRLGFGSTFEKFSLLPLSLVPDSFTEQLKECARKFADYQIRAIDKNIKLYECMKFSEKKLILEVKDYCCTEYIARCKLKTLPRDKAILPTIHMDGMHGLHSVSPANNDPSDVLERRSSNSLLGRMEKMHQPWSEVVRAEERLFKFGQEDSHNLSDSDAAKQVLSLLGCSLSGCTKGEMGREVEGQSVAAAGIDIEPDDILTLRNHGKTVDKHDFNTLNGRKVEEVTNSRFCRNDSLKKLINTIQRAEIIKESHKTEFTSISSCCIPCHALLSASYQFFLNAEGLNMAAVDALTGVVSQAPASDDQPLTFLDLWGAPSSYGQYVYWTRSSCNIRGWGVVRSERPSMRSSPTLAKLVQWDSFQILGSVQGLNITNNDTIKSIIAAVEADCPSGVELVFGDLSSLPFGAHHPGREEYHTKQQLLAQCVLALSLLAQGGSFVIRVYSLLTRFSVGLFYLLYKVFQEVAILKPFTSFPTSSEQFIVCKGFNGCQPIVRELLLGVNNQISELRQKKQQHGSVGGARAGTSAEGMDVLEIIPVQLLFEESFYQYITKRNERTALLQTHTIMQLENYRINPQKLPSVEMQDKLRRGLLELLKLPSDLS